jgi:maleylacetoacetate isomerase
MHLKGLAYQPRLVNLLDRGGEQHTERFRATNPQGLVPVLVDGALVLSQSMAIIEYLDETIPQPPLLPGDVFSRAYVRALAQIIACDIHPLQNLRVGDYLTDKLGCSGDQVLAWQRHWIVTGLQAVEAQLGRWGLYGEYCCGDSPTLADICLIPQVYNARRVNCNLTAVPQVNRIYATCMYRSEFIAAAPEAQPDAVELVPT